MMYQRRVALSWLAVVASAWALPDDEGTCDVSTGACGSRAMGEEDEDVLSALQVHHRHMEASQEDQEAETGSAVSLVSKEAVSKVDAESSFVFTTGVLTAALGGAVVSAASSFVVNNVFDQIAGDDSFKKAVGPTGLPLTVAVINDTPNPVQYTGFKLRDGKAWGLPALKRTLMPGEMMDWFLFTPTTGVLATMQFQSLADIKKGTNSTKRNWAIAAAQYRTGNLFENCDRLRTNVKPSADMDEAAKGLCRSGSGEPGIKVTGGYEVAIFLEEAGKAED